MVERKEQTMEKTIKRPSLKYALLTLGTLVIFVVLCLLVFKIPIIITLFLSWILLTPFAMKLGYKISDVENTIYDMIKTASGMFALLLAIGCMVAIWICAGTVPTLINWGLKLVSPKMFLCVAFLFCAILSVPTGTSWGTMSTAGIAMLGVGMGLGINPAMVVGACVAGSHVGDAISPASDTPLLTATTCEVPLLSHLKHNLNLIVPAVLISAVIYAVFGILFVDASMDKASLDAISADLAASMNLGVITLIPLLVVVILLIMKQSALSAILAGSLVGMIFAVVYQGYSIGEVGSFMASGFHIETGNALLDPILNRGGVSSMLELLSMIIASLGMGGILKGTQTLDVIVESMSKVINSRFGLTTATFAGCVMCLAVVSTNYFSIILNSTLFTPLYTKLGYKKENASRIVNNLSCLLSPFVPWGLAGIFVAATFDINVVSIIPYCFFNIVAVILCLVYGYAGINMTKIEEGDEI
jgi:NhaC family Na+:H+ antiporter